MAEETTIIDLFNMIATNPVMRAKAMQRIAVQIRALSIWPKEFMEQIVLGEQEEVKNVNKEADAIARAVIGEDNAVKADKNRDQAIKLVTLFSEQVKPVLDKITEECGFVNDPDTFNKTPREFIKGDKDEGWEQRMEQL